MHPGMGNIYRKVKSRTLGFKNLVGGGRVYQPY